MNIKMIKAEKKGIRLRFAFCGATGSGKTFSALRLATALGDPICVIDTERGSASKYADQFSFFTIPLEDYSPEAYCEALRLCADEHVPVVVVDSLSHAWEAEGGVLSIKDKVSAASRSGNDFTAWREVTPRHNKLVSAMLAYPGHLIVTMRSKMEYVLSKGANGKQVVDKIGMKPIQREGVEYEFDIVGDMQTGRLDITKTRCSALDGYSEYHPGRDLADRVKAWLGDAAPAEPAPQPQAPQDPLQKKLEALEKVRALAEGKGLSEEVALQGIEELEAIRMPIPEQIAWLRDRYASIKSGNYPATVQEQEPAPAPKRSKAAAAEAARAHLAAQQTPPPWPERRRKAEEAIRQESLRLGRGPGEDLARLGTVDDSAGPAIQAAWLSEATQIYQQLRAQGVTP